MLVASGSFSIGPVIFRSLNEASWRWIFDLNIVVGVLAIVVMLLLLREESLVPRSIQELEGIAYQQTRAEC